MEDPRTGEEDPAADGWGGEVVGLVILRLILGLFALGLISLVWLLLLGG